MTNVSAAATIPRTESTRIEPTSGVEPKKAVRIVACRDGFVNPSSGVYMGSRHGFRAGGPLLVSAHGPAWFLCAVYLTVDDERTYVRDTHTGHWRVARMRFVVLAAMLAAIGGSLFGYD